VTPEQKAALDLAVLNLKTHGDDQLLSAVQPLIDFYEARRTVSGQEAQPVCAHCNGTDVELLRLCHNSSCSAYAREESFYKGWEDNAAPIPATELTDEQIRRIWLIETGTTEQDSPLAILDFARAILAAKEPK
jgi:hypothetical protein